MTTPLVSSEMVDVGVRVLRESGFLWGESSADHLLVRELLEKALSCHPMRTASSQEQSIPVKIEEKVLPIVPTDSARDYTAPSPTLLR